jgi:hypothetical protein
LFLQVHFEDFDIFILVEPLVHVKVEVTAVDNGFALDNLHFVSQGAHRVSLLRSKIRVIVAANDVTLLPRENLSDGAIFGIYGISLGLEALNFGLL